MQQDLLSTLVVATALLAMLCIGAAVAAPSSV